MGFLERGNPDATRASVRAWAIAGACAGAALSVALWAASDLPPRALLLFVPGMAALGAVAGGAVNWQVPPDGPDGG